MAAKCNKCVETIIRVDQVKACRYCKNDGTANEIPKDLADNTTIDVALERKTGLAARFSLLPKAPESEQGQRKSRKRFFGG